MQDIRVQVDLVNVEAGAEPVVVVGHHLLTVRLGSHITIIIIIIIIVIIIIIIILILLAWLKIISILSKSQSSTIFLSSDFFIS